MHEIALERDVLASQNAEGMTGEANPIGFLCGTVGHAGRS
jgi:hypothetical protein